MIHDTRGSDQIHIERLEILARVGVSDEERASAQRLTINITYGSHVLRPRWKTRSSGRLITPPSARKTNALFRPVLTGLIETWPTRWRSSA